MQDVTDPKALTICDLWTSREDFDVYVRCAEYRLLLAVIDLSMTPPDISFDDLEHIGGLDLVQTLRGPHANDSGGCLDMIAEAPPTPIARGWARAARTGSADGVFFDATGNSHQSAEGP